MRIFSLKMEPEMSLYNRPENSSNKNQSSQIGFAWKKSQRINVKSRYKMFMPVATFQLVRYMLIVVQFWIWNWVLFQKCFAFVQLLILVFHFLPLKQFKFIFFVLPLRIDKFPHHLWTFNLVYDNNVTDNPEQIHRFERSGFGWTG